MKIGIFSYNFPHYKTQQGIYNLILNNIKPSVVFSANPVELNFYTSKLRVAPKYINLTNTIDIANVFNIDHYIVEHNSQKTKSLIKQYELDIGIILGSRIIKQDIIDAFSIGILNMHPGIIPINRGLDNLKWAIHDEIKQGVTTHLISSEIDKGSIIDKQCINVFLDDTLIDIHVRLQELELKMMMEALQKLKDGFLPVNQVENGKYNKAMPKNKEELLMTNFKAYKTKYKHMQQ
jgi:methionyl-tRNA formyltransferase